MILKLLASFIFMLNFLEMSLLERLRSSPVENELLNDSYKKNIIKNIELSSSTLEVHRKLGQTGARNRLRK